MTDDPPVGPRPAGMEIPLSPGQERLWFLDRLDPGDPAYNMVLVERLRGRLDAGALERALNGIVARHEILRTRFPAVDGHPVQIVAPEQWIEIERAGPVTDKRARELVAERTNAPFDLAAGPMLRATLLELDDRDHVLCVVLHHIVADGWSFGVLFDELEAGYEGTPVDGPPIQYGDYAVWQRDRLTDEVIAEQLAYWKDRLAGATPIDLPLDHPRPPVKTTNGAFADRPIPERLWDGVVRLAREERCTPYMTLLAAFQVLLARYSGQDDVCVGSPVSGRDREELEGLVGFLVNTLVLRGDLSGDPSFREVMGRTRRTALEAYEHQDIPFEHLLAELGVDRDLGRNPLFETLFNLYPPSTGLRLAGLEAEPFDSGHTSAKFDLMLEIHPGERAARASFNYNTDLFDAATVDQLAGHFIDVLEAVAADSDIRLSRLYRRLGLPATDVAADEAPDAPPDRQAAPPCTRIPLFEPSRHEGVALVSHGEPGAGGWGEEGQVTYAELAERADRLAGALRARGVGPGSLVGVCLERGPEAVTALLAVWRAGAAYLPLDPAYPPARLAYMLSDSGAGLVVTTERLLGRLPDVPALCLESLCSESPCPGGPVSAGEPAPGDLAYVIYTSGSTGLPKAVAVEHGALASRVAWMRDHYGLRPGDRVLQFASLSFDTHAEEIYPCLAAGATLVMTGEPLPDFLSGPYGGALTVLDLPTSYWHELVAASVAWPTSLRLMIIGAEQADPAAVTRWHEIAGEGVRLVNTYGPTETTIVATAAELTGTRGPRRPPIGRPLPGTTAHVLDRWLNPVPLGVPGELHLGGAGLARGYLGRPGLTAERFVPDPFGPPGARLYRTGDRVRHRRDGQLEFIGRLDDQVKVRGYRIEPGEIEAQITAHPAVRQARVVVRDDSPGLLVAYVAADAGTVSGLKAHLAERLPEHMIPAAFVPLDRLPLTPGGKLDLAALPAPEWRSASYVAPRTEAEELVAAVWAEVLGLDRVGALDDFFDLGGHSLLATRVIARIGRNVQLDVPLRTAFTHRTVERLAAAVEKLVVADLERLSDEEATRLLSGEAWPS
ncbi:amino acid adenylation domain-containing protein [Planotetraspora sp. A-T 1434]|uniref:amino acid adenylation domain-containing protein n=1 Tax=Planotetraspora sp. A-T 1434 TaxID=2979219 RepID=UPI0021BE51D0|nr:amino acid adenylation domain-containing protein [Planotetraspora sp. A-T 1434]MCT9930234.1 amino acid adenylation domain-containing protein [Planotetraspora sp. A-T 1434]